MNGKATGPKRGQMEESKGKDRGSAASKAVGLTDGLKAEIEQDPDLV